MQQLIAFLLQNAIIDFSGDLSIEMVKDFLRDDSSPEARNLLAKVVAERNTEAMILTLADCLQEHIGSGVTPAVVLEQLKMYSES